MSGIECYFHIFSGVFMGWCVWVSVVLPTTFCFNLLLEFVLKRFRKIIKNVPSKKLNKLIKCTSLNIILWHVFSYLNVFENTKHWIVFDDD